MSNISNINAHSKRKSKMGIQIKFETDNAAFEDDFAGEVRQVLSQIDVHLETLVDLTELALRDSYGNTVGRVVITTEDWT